MALALYLVSLIYIEKIPSHFCPFKTKNHLMSGCTFVASSFALISNYINSVHLLLHSFGHLLAV